MQWGADKPTIYATPSIEYAGNPVYSRFYEKGGKKLPMVFQLRVRKPVRKQGDLSAGLWSKVADSNFPSGEDTCEWLFEGPADVQVYGMMIREVPVEVLAKWPGFH